MPPPNSPGLLPGAEIGYDPITGDVTVSSTTEASGTTVIACAEHLFDGEPVIVEFYCDRAIPASPSSSSSPSILTISLFEGGTQITRIAVVVMLANTTSNVALQVPVRTFYRFTPTLGRHTYTVSAFLANNSGNGTVKAGSGGTAGEAPACVRFTKA